VDEITVRFQNPKELLIGYINEHYRNFKDHCEISNKPISIPDCVLCLKKSFYPPNRQHYECDNFKRAYLIGYYPTQFTQYEYLIREYLLPYITKKTNLTALSMGGGPSPELLALLNELHSSGIAHELSFFNVDREPSWKTIYLDLANYLVKINRNINLTAEFIPSDIINYSINWQFDIVFIPWVLSEIEENYRLYLIKHAIELTTTQGLMLLTDRVEDALIDSISNKVEKSDGIIIERIGTISGMWCGISFPEETRNLYGIRCVSTAAYWVLKKTTNH
jgi:hypothetical protein